MNPPSFPSLKHLVIFALLVTGIFFLNNLAPSHQSPPTITYSAAEKAYADNHIIAISSETLTEKLATQNAPFLLHIYASWCPFCQQQKPILESVLKEIGAEALFLSTDKDSSALARYLMQKGGEPSYIPWLITNSNSQEILNILIEKGINFDGAIPYTAIIQKDGKVLAEFRGLVDKSRILEAFVK